MLQRIASFLPSATELIYALGAQDRLLGVTHECLYPREAESKPRIISSVIDSEALDSRQIDEMACKLASDGKDVFVLNEENVMRASPDLIISQSTCEVCAAHADQVRQAVEMLDEKPEIYSMDPHSVGEILEGVTELSEILGVQESGDALRRELEQRIERIKNADKGDVPEVVAVEWISPFFTAGHWVPEMIEIAGGASLISKTGEHSRRMDMLEIAEADPEIIVLMPCGFDVKRTRAEYEKFLRGDQKWNELRAVRGGRVFAVDANSFFSKPSIRTVDGIEILAKVMHPETCAGIPTPENSHVRLG